MTSHRRGFTLIELLVVIAIIGILSSVVLASLNSARVKGREARRLSDIKQIQVALELYNDANGSYPSAIADLVPTYMPGTPTDPLGGTSDDYGYVQVSSGASYYVGALLETAHTALSGDTDDSQAITIGAVSANASTNCSTSDSTGITSGTGSGRYVFCVKP